MLKKIIKQHVTDRTSTITFLFIINRFDFHVIDYFDSIQNRLHFDKQDSKGITSNMTLNS